MMTSTCAVPQAFSVWNTTKGDPLHKPIPHTTKHGGGLNITETDLGLLHRQCLDRRLEDPTVVRAEVGAWETKCNEAKVTIHRRFTVTDARVKLKNVSRSIEI
jgi:hypothetical protein